MKVNDLKFDRQGTTATGAPFYKARGTELYIYYDPNCAPGQPARWILDNDAPSTQRTADLDVDGECNYLARTESNNKNAPPDSASWSMNCGSGWQVLTIKLHESFTKVSSGTCEDVGRLPILTASMCSAAAKYLQLPDTTPELAAEDSENSPQGCYWDKSSLHLAIHASSKGKGATGSLELICSDGGKETQALMSTAMGWHRNLAVLGLLFPALTWALSCRLG